MEEQYHLRANIPKLKGIAFVRGAMIHVPIFVLFLQSNGLNLQEVFLLQSCFSVVQFLFEIPSGYLSDRWGRKRTILLASICKAVGMIFFCINASFVGFLPAVSLMAIGSSLYSGTVDALTYDTLLNLGETARYRSIHGRNEGIRFGAEALGSLLTGVLAPISLRAPLWATFGFFCIGPFIALTLHEPRRHVLQETRHIHSIANAFREHIVDNPAIRSVMTLNILIILLSFTLYWFTQPYQVQVGLPLALFGLVHMVVVGAHALASAGVHTLERWIDDRILMALMAAAVIGSFLMIGLFSSLWMLVFFVIVRAVWGMSMPLTSDIVNRMVPSSVRATILSFGAFTFRVLFALTAPVVGYVADIWTLNQAILAVGIVGGIAILITFMMMRGVWARIPS